MVRVLPGRILALMPLSFGSGRAQEALTVTQGLCTLQYTVGRIEPCLGARCPFWEVEGEEGACVLAPVTQEIVGRPSLAHHLLGLRRELDGTSARSGWSLFYKLLNEEQEAEG